MSSNIISPDFRGAFMNIFTPSRPLNPGQEAKYGCTMLFPPDTDLSELRALAAATAKEKWGENLPAGLRSPFRAAEEKEYGGFEPGWTFVAATSKGRPGAVDAKVQEVIDPDALYPGAWYRAQIRFFAYDKAGNKGVGCGLQNIQFMKDDARLDGRQKATEVFGKAPGAGAKTTEDIFG